MGLGWRMPEMFGGEDMSDALDMLATGRYQVTRFGVTTVDAAGRKNPPASTQQFEATGVLWPLGGKELERLPEGLRNREVQMFATATELRTLEATLPDVLTIDGFQWECAKASTWRAGNFFTYVLARRP